MIKKYGKLILYQQLQTLYLIGLIHSIVGFIEIVSVKFEQLVTSRTGWLRLYLLYLSHAFNLQNSAKEALKCRSIVWLCNLFKWSLQLQSRNTTNKVMTIWELDKELNISYWSIRIYKWNESEWNLFSDFWADGNLLTNFHKIEGSLWCWSGFDDQKYN